MRLLVAFALAAACGSPEPIKIENGLRIEYTLENEQASAEQAAGVIRKRIAGARLLATATANGDTIVVDLDQERSRYDLYRTKALFTHVGAFEVRPVGSDRVILTNAAIASASASVDPNTGEPVVILEISDAHVGAFRDATAKLVGEKVAIVFDGHVMNTPIIREPLGGQLWMSVGAAGDAREVAIVLASGRLPSPLREARVSLLEHGTLIKVGDDGTVIKVPK